MLTISLKWRDLTDDQKSQIKVLYKDQLRKKELFEHNLNTRSFRINPLTGGVIQPKA